MTVVNALGAFLDIALKKGNWSPTKGASLKTYFIGQCKIQFANVYKGVVARPASPATVGLVRRPR